MSLGQSSNQTCKSGPMLACLAKALATLLHDRLTKHNWPQNVQGDLSGNSTDRDVNYERT